MKVDNLRSNGLERPEVKTEGKIKGRGHIGSKYVCALFIFGDNLEGLGASA